jgi:Cu/Ag efflux protein CusF
MKFTPTMVAVFAASVVVAAGAQQAPTTSSTVAVAPGKAVATNTTTASAVIVSIDATYRIVTLKTASGKVVEVVAGPEVKNFDQLKVGQKVKAAYSEALSLELKKGGGKPLAMTEKGGAAQAAPGAKPGAGGARQITILADVVKVDTKTHLVTLRGPGGNSVDLHVEDPEQLKNIKKGDQVEAVYTEAVAVTVEPADK